MSRRYSLPVSAALGVLLLIAFTPTKAAIVVYHYAPAGGPDAPLAQQGQRLAWFGMSRQPYNCPPKPTCVVTFQHPCTHQQVSVPLALPQDSTPKMEYRTNRVIYDYGSQTVEVHFLKDGGFDVIYNSGLLRAP